MATGGVLYGSSKAQEGIHQVFLGANGKGEEKSYNYLRDTVFQGNQAVYDAVGMFSTFGPALPSIVKAIPQLAVPVLGALGLRQGVYEATGSEEAANLATDAMMFGPVLQQVNKAINPGQMDDIIIQTSDEALNFVDDVLDDGFKNTVNNVVDDTASQVTSEASALESGNATFKSNEEALKYYSDLAERLNVNTGNNQAVFYSGPGNRLLAEQFAKENSKLTLEMTPGGKYLDDLKLFDSNSPLTGEQANEIWRMLSKRYAENASGTAFGFTHGSSADSIFNTIEYPALEGNKDIINVITEFFNK